MSATARPMRAVLYIPGSKPRALDKARGLPCDAVSFDLEAPAAPEEPPDPRETHAQAPAAASHGTPPPGGGGPRGGGSPVRVQSSFTPNCIRGFWNKHISGGDNTKKKPGKGCRAEACE